MYHLSPDLLEHVPRGPRKIKDAPSLFRDHKAMVNDRRRKRELNKKLRKVRRKYQEPG